MECFVGCQNIRNGKLVRRMHPRNGFPQNSDELEEFRSHLEIAHCFEHCFVLGVTTKMLILHIKNLIITMQINKVDTHLTRTTFSNKE